MDPILDAAGFSLLAIVIERRVLQRRRAEVAALRGYESRRVDEPVERHRRGALIIWDRLFGTFEPESEAVVYGLTKNVGSFNLL